MLTLRRRLAWAHDSNTNRLFGNRAEMKWKNGVSLEGEFSRSTQTYTGKGTMHYEW